MLKSHVRFYSATGKRLVLVADDEPVNRELLTYILQGDFDLLTASNGREVLQLVREHAERLSLVLLDLMMPELDGFRVLESMGAEGLLPRLPVIVITSEKAAEVRSLRLGASDFITKPFELPEVILARVQRTIELSEDRDILQGTERDSLTGLFNKEFFYRYAAQYDRVHDGKAMDAYVLDINHFHLVNEINGKAYGDLVLRRIAEQLRRVVAETGCMAARREGDRFMVYAPHGCLDGETLLAGVMQQLDDINSARIRIRMGIYPEADRSVSVEERFDRAKAASDSLRDNYTRFISIYDRSAYEQQMFAEQLIDEMDTALLHRQFEVWFQPKYDICGESPRLTSAEALVRWRHPERGMISPGRFIPLFEKNGLIQKLDHYVWREAAAHCARWKAAYGVDIPVSVNVSRIDIFDPDLVPKLLKIVSDAGLTTDDLLLEITESAYAEDSGQIIQAVAALRERGFRIEMDDFGSGYSSLNMLAELPLDILKLDMRFVRALEKDGSGKALRMLELMTDIARFLQVPVIAEGVETKDQLDIMKRLGVDTVQGYYFSKPLPAEEFETLLSS